MQRFRSHGDEVIARREERAATIPARWFERGQEIPPEYVPFIHNQAVVSEPLPHLVAQAEAEGRPPPELPEYPEFDDLRTVTDVLDWALTQADDLEERHRRALYAMEREHERDPRRTVVNQLTAFLQAEGLDTPKPPEEILTEDQDW